MKFLYLCNTLYSLQSYLILALLIGAALADPAADPAAKPKAEPEADAKPDAKAKPKPKAQYGHHGHHASIYGGYGSSGHTASLTPYGPPPQPLHYEPPPLHYKPEPEPIYVQVRLNSRFKVNDTELRLIRLHLRGFIR